MASASAAYDPRGTNPFTPAFGRIPAYMAGREQIIDDMAAAFRFGGANPDLCSIFVGARGTGKTALLSYLALEAEANGWIAANVTASPRMLEEIEECVTREGAHLLEADNAPRLTSIGIAPIGSVSWENVPAASAGWRQRMNTLLDQLDRTDTGLLITVDEVDPSLDEMTELVATYQHFVRENRKVALLMAGLPHRVSSLLSGKSTSFLRRAARHDLGSIPRYEVEDAFRLTAQKGGRDIDDDALERAADAIGGFPFMFQLVGYRAWNAAGTSDALDIKSIDRGVRLAQEELAARVFDATWAELSGADQAFARAMARDVGATSRADLTARLGKSSSHVSTYKKRLLEAGVIEEPQRGTFTFALPGFAEYVRAR